MISPLHEAGSIAEEVTTRNPHEGSEMRELTWVGDRRCRFARNYQIEVLEAPTGRDIDTAFARLAQKPIDALLVGPGPLLDNHRIQLGTLASYHRPPAIYPLRVFAEAGGLMSRRPAL